jgi:hypothetical protein
MPVFSINVTNDKPYHEMRWMKQSVYINSTDLSDISTQYVVAYVFMVEHVK